MFQDFVDDNTPPGLFGLTDVASFAAASLDWSTDTGDGTAYAVWLPNGAPAPNVEQILSGTDGAGNPAVVSISQPVTQSGMQSPLTANGLINATTYDRYVFQRDNHRNDSAIASGSVTPVASGAAPPSLVGAYSQADNIALTSQTTPNAFPAAGRYLVFVTSIDPNTSNPTFLLSGTGVSTVSLLQDTKIEKTGRASIHVFEVIVSASSDLTVAETAGVISYNRELVLFDISAQTTAGAIVGVSGGSNAATVSVTTASAPAGWHAIAAVIDRGGAGSGFDWLDGFAIDDEDLDKNLSEGGLDHRVGSASKVTETWGTFSATATILGHTGISDSALAVILIGDT